MISRGPEASTGSTNEFSLTRAGVSPKLMPRTVIVPFATSGTALVITGGSLNCASAACMGANQMIRASASGNLRAVFIASPISPRNFVLIISLGDDMR
jgi:hypothetical protein